MTSGAYSTNPSSDGDPEPRVSTRQIHPLLPLVMFGIVALLMALDVVFDAMAGAVPAHVWLEVALAVLASAGVALFARQWQRERAHARDQANALSHRTDQLASAEAEVTRWHAEAELWRKEAQDAVAGLSVHIDRQFERWSLTPAEREVALLLLKGLSLKEAAMVRDVSERTVRDQARAIYRKADLAGRAELSAFFLEDLLLPS